MKWRTPGAAVMSDKNQRSDTSVIDLTQARVRRARTNKATGESLQAELDEIELLLDNGQSSEARSRLASLISDSRNDPALLARARLALSLAFEMHGKYRDSLEALSMYESADRRAD